MCHTAHRGTVPGTTVLGLLSGGSFLVAQVLNFPVSVHDTATNLWLLHSIVFKHQLEYSVCGVHTTCLFFPFHFYLTGQTLGVHIVFSTRGPAP